MTEIGITGNIADNSAPRVLLEPKYTEIKLPPFLIHI